MTWLHGTDLAHKLYFLHPWFKANDLPDKLIGKFFSSQKCNSAKPSAPAGLNYFPYSWEELRVGIVFLRNHSQPWSVMQIRCLLHSVFKFSLIIAVQPELSSVPHKLWLQLAPARTSLGTVPHPFFP